MIELGQSPARITAFDGMFPSGAATLLQVGRSGNSSGNHEEQFGHVRNMHCSGSVLLRVLL
jgi:hypothetical protein